MRAIIIDNEERAVKTMVRLLEIYCPEVTTVKYAIDAQEGIDYINKYIPDVIFLDIEMPGLNGFEVCEKINCEKSRIVFTTAHSQYAIKAIKHHAFDYLLKPIDPIELATSVKKIENHIKDQTSNNLLKSQLAEDRRIKYEQYDLTKRETEIIDLSLTVKSAKDLSSHLFLSTYTINNHFQNIFKKVGVKNRFELEKK